MEAEINNDGSDGRCRGRLESARDGICNAHRCARRGEGVLEIESNEPSSAMRTWWPRSIQVPPALFSFADAIETAFILALRWLARPSLASVPNLDARLRAMVG